MDKNKVNLDKAIDLLVLKSWERGFILGFFSGVIGTAICLIIASIH